MAWFDLLKHENGTPRGRWVWPADEQQKGGQRQQTALFTATLTLAAEAVRLELHVCAEGRYTVWLDAQADALGRGPARSDLQHRAMDVYEIDFSGERPPGAGGGELTVWAQVRWWGGPPEAPLAEMVGPVPGFLAVALFFDGYGNVVGSVGTGERDYWRGCLSEGLAGRRIEGIPAFVAIGEAEVHRSGKFPADWRTRGGRMRDVQWGVPAVVGDPYFRDDATIPTGPPSPHGWLVEREVAHPVENVVPLRDVRQVLANGTFETVPTLNGVRAGSGERLRFRVDVGEEVLAYLRLTLAGAGTTCVIRSGEVWFLEQEGKSFSIEAPADARLHPLEDTFHHDGAGATHRFETAHWRAFRFLEIELTGGPEGGAIETLELVGTAYPFEREFEFEAHADEEGAAGRAEGSPEPEAVAETIQKIVDVSWRTLRCCTWETYMDCPYYEQLQYIGDTRLQCLITYVTTGDVTLPAQALRAFDRSRFTGGAEGLTLSRYPCHTAVAQVIPTFSLIYILMIEDYLVHTGDEALVAELRPGIAPILNWFSPAMNPETGLLGRVRYWPFVDWVNGWKTGIPPCSLRDLEGEAGAGDARRGRRTDRDASAILNLHYLLALQAASRVYERSKAGAGNLYAGRAAVLKQRIYDTFYDAGRGLVCDIPLEQEKGGGGGGRAKLGVWSQHAQALAVLADVLSPTEARQALETALDPRKVLRASEAVGDRAAGEEGRFLAPASFYFRFYLAEALAKLRMGDRLWPLLEPFRAALKRGSTTWPEALEPSRSECHAWSAWPLYFFARHLLGITPPGADDRTGSAGAVDAKIRVRPLACPPLRSARGRFVGPRGPVDVQVHWPSDGVGGLATPEVQASGAGVEVSRA